MFAILHAVKFSYYTSALFSLTVLVLSLLDLGFLSFFLDIAVPSCTLVHHITLYIIHRRRQVRKTTLEPSTLPSYAMNVANLTLLCLLAILWLAATMTISPMASLISDDSSDYLSDGVETRASVISQTVFAAMECALMWGMFGIGVHERKRSRVSVIPPTSVIDKN